MTSSSLDQRMGSAPMGPLILQTGIPLMFSLLTNSLYNLVDSIFVSRVCEDALTALAMASPVQAVVGALGCGIAVGFNAAVSKAMGEQDREKVRATSAAALFLALCAYILVALVGLLLAGPYFAWQAGGNESIARYGVQYLTICMVFSFGQLGQWVFDRLLIATGRSSLFLISLGFASGINLILDPILIFGWFGFPEMGTQGAAIATVIGQCGGALMGWWLNVRFNRDIPVAFSLKPDWGCVGNILRVGIPTSVMQSVVAFGGVFMNVVLRSFSSTAVAVYGICVRIKNLSLIGPRGIDNGLIPILAYNYGARNQTRVLSSIRWALLFGHIFMAVVTMVLALFPVPILRLFDASQEMLGIGTTAIRVMALAFFLCTGATMFSTVFQALGLGSYSMVLTILEQVALPLTLTALLATTGSLNAVWWGFAAAEAFSWPIALGLMARTRKTVIAPLGNGKKSPL